jgi:peptide chain release factor 1
MKPSLLAKLTRLEERLEEVTALLSAEDAARDPDGFRRLNREHAELLELVGHFLAWKRARDDRAAAEQLRTDPELRAFADEESAAADVRLASEAATLARLLLPRDPDDGRDVILEVRAGTGGQESALFAGELLRMYLRYAERRGWQVEVLSESAAELGGVKEAIVRLAGRDVYARLKFESGGHRVQRVPETEAQGRLHTSACTVAVMPEADDGGEVAIAPGEIRIDVFRASGAGGQHVNKTESAVRITHLPTGLVAECQDDRSQHRNKDRAMKVLATRLRDLRRREAHAKEAATRKSLVGSGDRSERIRTYHFPQGRVTDHRIGLTLHTLQAVLDGDLDGLVGPLMAEHQADRLARMAETPDAA